MKAYVFPGQASQFPGMGKDLYDANKSVRVLFEEADDILNFKLSDVMFEGTVEELKQTKVTQPAVFLHSIAARTAANEFLPDMVAGHSLGEFSALVASKALDFETGLHLVNKRAMAMQDACDMTEGTMAAIVGLEDKVIEDICESIESEVVPANYNCPGQLVISGDKKGITEAVEKLKEAGAKRAIILTVGGAFHSPLMEPARESLAKAISNAEFKIPICPIYQNVDGLGNTDPGSIKEKLIQQLTSPVLWTQSMKNMIKDGANGFVEVGGNGKTLSSFIKRLDRSIETSIL